MTITRYLRLRSAVVDHLFLTVIVGGSNQLIFIIMRETGEDMVKAATEGSPYFIAWMAFSIVLFLNKDIYILAAALGKL